MDWSHPLIVAFAPSLLPAAVALLVYFKVSRLHLEVNGKMQKLLEMTGLEALSRGELKGAEDERHRQEDGS